jgi:hypothetical protein
MAISGLVSVAVDGRGSYAQWSAGGSARRIGTGLGVSEHGPVVLPSALGEDPLMRAGLEELAHVVRERCDAEKRARVLGDPWPLPLAWTERLPDDDPGGTRERSDHPTAAIVRLFTGLPSRRLVIMGLVRAQLAPSEEHSAVTPSAVASGRPSRRRLSRCPGTCSQRSEPESAGELGA